MGLPPCLTVPAALARAVDTWPDAPALEDGEVALTYRSLSSQAHAVARALVARGIRPGDHVAIWAPNLAEWVVAGLGIHLAGGVIVPINTRYKAAEASYLLERTSARLLFTVAGFLGLDFVGMLDRPDLPTVVLRGDAPAGTTAFDDLLAEAADVTLPEVGPDDPSDVLFTSGTTGQPKGAVTTHAQTVRAYWTWSDVTGLRAGDRYLVVAPFFHCFGYKAGWVACLLRGAVILPQAVFDADAVLARIPRDRVTVVPGPPALYQSLLQKDLRGHDLSSLRLAVTGAASIPVQLVRDMKDVLGFDTVITGYGLTEATGIATMCRYDDDAQTIATTSGRAIPDVEVAVVDAQGTPVPPGTPGHVVVRGYNVMQGYLDDPERTAEAIVDGWLQTGDIGVMDARGYLAITDRLKDMFIVGGFNAYPAEIEHVLLSHPDVRDVAVIGVPEARLGEVGMAFVVADGLDAATLIAWCRERMANFKVPRHVRFLDTLPRNASGKVTKPDLRRLAAERPDGWALVVGGSGGIGSACAETLAARGRAVVVTWRHHDEAARAVCARIRAAGGTASTMQLTLPEADDLDLQGLGTLVWAAGADIGQPYVARTDPADLRSAVDLEVHGFFEVLRAALPALRDRRGSVVAVTTAGNARHPPGDVLSTAPKAALEAILRGVAREEGRHGVRANAVAVGVVQGGLFERIDLPEGWREAAIRNIPLRRFGTPADVGEAVAWLASDAAGYVTGQVIFVDGGYHV
ncbi:MAG: SDR family oxidoreductase [Alphaproteobacteria bacterium]|nr:SDR family oxidoreductase [Alphaproteobacteria bacterium]